MDWVGHSFEEIVQGIGIGERRAGCTRDDINVVELHRKLQLQQDIAVDELPLPCAGRAWAAQVEDGKRCSACGCCVRRHRVVPRVSALLG